MTSRTAIRLDDQLHRALQRRVKREPGQTTSAIVRAALSSYLQHETLASQSASDIRTTLDQMVDSNAQSVLALREEVAPLIALLRDLLARLETDTPVTAAHQRQSERANNLLSNFKRTTAPAEPPR